jgi:hypothetical protein
VRDGWDDEQLLGSLREAVKARQDVPPEFVEAGKGAYAWRDIDAELARLTYDSSRDTDRAGVRSETASIRALTFTSAHVTVEVEVADGSLLGQIMPPGEGRIEARARTGAIIPAPVDEIGCFTIEPIPDSPFRLYCQTAQGVEVLTGWIML